MLEFLSPFIFSWLGHNAMSQATLMLPRLPSYPGLYLHTMSPNSLFFVGNFVTATAMVIVFFCQKHSSYSCVDGYLDFLFHPIDLVSWFMPFHAVLFIWLKSKTCNQVRFYLKLFFFFLLSFVLGVCGLLSFCVNFKVFFFPPIWVANGYFMGKALHLQMIDFFSPQPFIQC